MYHNTPVQENTSYIVYTGELFKRIDKEIEITGFKYLSLIGVGPVIKLNCEYDIVFFKGTPDETIVQTVITADNYREFLDGHIYRITTVDNGYIRTGIREPKEEIKLVYEPKFANAVYIEDSTHEHHPSIKTVIEVLVKIYLRNIIVYEPFTNGIYNDDVFREFVDLVSKNDCFYPLRKMQESLLPPGTLYNGSDYEYYLNELVCKYLLSISTYLRDSLLELNLSVWGLYEITTTKKSTTTILQVGDYRIYRFMEMYRNGDIEL